MPKRVKKNTVELKEISPMVEQLDLAMVDKYARYKQLHDEFDEYRGKELDQDAIDALGEIFNEMQAIWKDMYSAFNYVIKRNADTLNIIQNYFEFMNELENGGFIAKDDEH